MEIRAIHMLEYGHKMRLISDPNYYLIGLRDNHVSLLETQKRRRHHKTAGHRRDEKMINAEIKLSTQGSYN